MNATEKEYFDLLVQDRTELDKALRKPSAKGIKRETVNKYSDSAHFIYEFLQNADDTGATRARFVLCKDRLIFAHNGPRSFTISDPKTEGEDGENGTLGDLNAITSIGNSSKAPGKDGNAPKIGKFGLGFKAVFSYTSSPSIYSQTFNFKIQDLIIPTLLPQKHKDQKPGETLFDLPFDNPECPRDKAFNDIEKKLDRLEFPLLFLNSLKKVEFTILNNEKLEGSYTKTINESLSFEDTTAEKIELSQTDTEGEKHCENLWLFSRKHDGLKYSVGFFLDENGKIVPREVNAFCYFATKEHTGLKFIIHAPFLLNNSREGIPGFEKHNKEMVDLLASLAADSILYLRDIGLQKGTRLIDDGILDVIPVSLNSRGYLQISFDVFYEKIKTIFQTQKILPTKDGYTDKAHAYWCAVADYLDVFDDEELSILTKQQEARWVFRSLGRKKTYNIAADEAKYVDEIVSRSVDDIFLLRSLSSELMEQQSFEWIAKKLYPFISGYDSRIKFVEQDNLPLFIDQNKKAVRLHRGNKEKDRIIFLPDQDFENDEDYALIHHDLFQYKETKDIAYKLYIHKVSLKDEIFSKIIPKYENNTKDTPLDTSTDFKKFFKYYCECSELNQKELVDRISNLPFLVYEDGENRCYAKPGELYFPNENLKRFCSGIHFVLQDEYVKMFPGQELIFKFLQSLGVNKHLRKLENEYNYETLPETFFGETKGTRPNEDSWIICEIEEVSSILESFFSVDFPDDPSFDPQNAHDASLFLWSELCAVIDRDCTHFPIENVYFGRHKYFRYTFREESCENRYLILLNLSPWLMNSSGQFVSCDEMLMEELSSEYDQTLPGANKLLAFLKFKEPAPEVTEKINSEYWSEDEKRKYALGDLLEKNGINPDSPEFEEFIQKWQREKERKERIRQQESSDALKEEQALLNNKILEEDDLLENTDSVSPGKRVESQNRSSSRVKISKSDSSSDDDLSDNDEYTRASVDLEKRIRNAQEKADQEIEDLQHKQELLDKVDEFPTYSYGWFMALLELEMEEASEKDVKSKDFAISFSRVRLEEGTERTLVLEHPNRPIPQNIEDLEGIPLKLHFVNSQAADRRMPIEVVSVKSYTLRVKLKDSDGLKGIPWDRIAEATLQVKNPVFLLKELLKHFQGLKEKLALDDEYDMKEHLPENLSFVFGPPGTGKTTWIAQKLSDLMETGNTEESLRILVLAPTNKAADVIVKRVISLEGEEFCKDWLVRFGLTQDSELEKSEIYQEHSFDYASKDRFSLVTTIARYSYDNFKSGLAIANGEWDYVVIDEASMIPLVTILNVIYHASPKQFIIAGDPFQIEPIMTLKQWKDKNIYEMVELKSFMNPATKPRQYPVEKLTTQYRSIPSIGRIFSQLTYDGILEHNRSEEDRRVLAIQGQQLEPINLLYFPVSKYESIYRAKKLNKSSSYQVYTALFAYEYVKYLLNNLEFDKSEGPVRLGVIAPYAAQAHLIENLVQKLPRSKDFVVSVGTIHGFQGDECDIIIGVFNPTTSVSPGPDCFLNKRNIINVCVSRARDCLVLLMPDQDAQGRENLTVLNHLERLCRQEESCKKIQTHDLEQLIFGSPSYLEDNSFATGHLSVNVYSRAEHRYEIRSDDNAVDIQVVERS